MSYVDSDNPYRSPNLLIAAQADADDRVAFLRKTYLHLAGAIGAFVVIEAVLLETVGDKLTALVLGSRFAWLLVLGGMALVGRLAQGWAESANSRSTQYLGLGLYVVAETLIFAPLLYIARHFVGPEVIPTAGAITLTVFGGLTAVVFFTGADFSFLRTGLSLAGLVALGLIVCGILFGFSLGLWFSVALVGLAGGYILYDTSNVLHHYRIGQHVSAALALFASVALLFWYVVRIVMELKSRD